MNPQPTHPGAKPEADARHQRDPQLVIFHVGDLACALDIATTQEIKGQLEIVEVPGTARNVRGIANLRGQVITVIDLRRVFDIPPKPIDSESRIVVVRDEGAVIGLLADSVEDIVIANAEDLEPPPANISGVPGEFFDSVYKRSEDLVCVLSIKHILRRE